MHDITVFNAVSALIPDASPVTAAAALPPKPRLTLGYLPARSQSISFDGTLLDYLPVQLICIGSSCTGGFASGTPSQGYNFIGLIDPAGVQHEQLDYTAYFNQLIATEMIDLTSPLAQGSTLIEEDYWELQFSVDVPPDTPFGTDQMVTTGASETDQTIFSYTVGVMPPELSASLTRSFQHTVEVTNQQSTTYHFQWPAHAVETTVGVYQLMRSFSVQAGSNLATYISQANKVIGECPSENNYDRCLKLKLGAAFPYPASAFFQAATTPPPPTVTTLGLNAAANIGELFTPR